MVPISHCILWWMRMSLLDVLGLSDCYANTSQYGFKRTETVLVANSEQEDQGLKLGLGATELGTINRCKIKFPLDFFAPSQSISNLAERSQTAEFDCHRMSLGLPFPFHSPSHPHLSFFAVKREIKSVACELTYGGVI